MSKPITISINCQKIDKSLMKDGKYLNLVIWPNKNGEDEYGNSHYVAQSVTKEQRDQGIKGPILGNARVPNDEPPRRAPAPQSKLPQRGGDYEF